MKRFTAILMAAIVVISSLDSCKRRHQPEAKPVVEPTMIISFTDGGAYFYGQPEGYPDLNMFCVYLLNGQTHCDGAISGVGTALWLDMNVEKNDADELAIGTYGPARNDFAKNSFLKGVMSEDGERISGSFVYFRDINGLPKYHMITNGTVQVNTSGNKVSIKAEVVADGVEYTFDYFDYFSYTDVIPTPDPGPGPGPDPEHGTDYTVNDMKYCIVESEGKVFDQHKTEDYWIWKVVLGTDQNWADGKEIQWEIVTSESATDIVGSYKVVAEEMNDKTISSILKPGSAICAYTEDNAQGGVDYYGSWFFPSNDESTWLGATEGTLDITKSNGTYTMTFNHKDRFNNYSSYSGKYVGSATVTKAAAAAPMRSTAASAKGNARKAVFGAAGVTGEGEGISAERRAYTSIGK